MDAIVNKKREDMIKDLINNPDQLIKKKPFTRGAEKSSKETVTTTITNNDTISATLPNYKKIIVPQETFLDELDPSCHKVLFDENIPSFTVKTQRDGWVEIQSAKMAIPFQRIIRNKKLLHLVGNPMKFTLAKDNPSQKEQDNFITFKEYWKKRNQDGMKALMVKTQFSVGDAGLLYYMDYKNRIKSRIISFEDGYVICSHNDSNGDRMIESIYYCVDNVEYIDSYTDTMHYRHSNNRDNNSNENGGWVLEKSEEHGFSEIPLITKRGKVAWDDAQSIIESYESLYNVFNVIQKKWGWGILYVKGRLDPKGKKMGGNIVMEDSSLDGTGDAKFLNPPTPQNTIDTLNTLKDSIQEASGCTFILPKDIRMSGDVSGIAVQLTQSLDIETAEENKIEWQNVADKMVRLFKEGLGKELVNQGINKQGVTDFDSINITATFDIWQPHSKTEYNQMLVTMEGAGILSKESAIELNTESKPDEKERVRKEKEEQEKKEIEIEERKHKANLELKKTNIQKTVINE